MLFACPKQAENSAELWDVYWMARNCVSQMMDMSARLAAAGDGCSALATEHDQAIVHIEGGLQKNNAMEPTVCSFFRTRKSRGHCCCVPVASLPSQVPAACMALSVVLCCASLLLKRISDSQNYPNRLVSCDTLSAAHSVCSPFRRLCCA